MKSIHTIILAILLPFTFSLSTVFAQNQMMMYVLKYNRISGTFNVSDIDSIIFTHPATLANDTMYVMKQGNIRGKFNVNDVDSIIFHQTTTAIPTVLNPTTGKIWMDRNLGASRVAESSTDTAAYGGLYQWGRATDGHEKRTSGITDTLSYSDTAGHGNFIITNSSPYDWRNMQNDNLWQEVIGANNPCPSGYRLPTAAELQEERGSWNSLDSTGAFNSPLKLPLAGIRRSFNGSLGSVGEFASYWSSSVDTEGAKAWSLYFHGNDAELDLNDRAMGQSVRCIKD